MLTLVFGSVGSASDARVAPAPVLITGSLCALMALFAAVAPVPVRTRRR